MVQAENVNSAKILPESFRSNDILFKVIENQSSIFKDLGRCILQSLKKLFNSSSSFETREFLSILDITFHLHELSEKEAPFEIFVIDPIELYNIPTMYVRCVYVIDDFLYIFLFVTTNTLLRWILWRNYYKCTPWPLGKSIVCY